jgi:hypothetical protein
MLRPGSRDARAAGGRTSQGGVGDLEQVVLFDAAGRYLRATPMLMRTTYSRSSSSEVEMRVIEVTLSGLGRTCLVVMQQAGAWPSATLRDYPPSPKVKPSSRSVTVTNHASSNHPEGWAQAVPSGLSAVETWDTHGHLMGDGCGADGLASRPLCRPAASQCWSRSGRSPRASGCPCGWKGRSGAHRGGSVCSAKGIHQRRWSNRCRVALRRTRCRPRGSG